MLSSDIYTNNDMRVPDQSGKIGLPKIAESKNKTCDVSLLTDTK